MIHELMNTVISECLHRSVGFVTHTHTHTICVSQGVALPCNPEFNKQRTHQIVFIRTKTTIFQFSFTLRSVRLSAVPPAEVLRLPDSSGHELARSNSKCHIFTQPRSKAGRELLLLKLFYRGGRASPVPYFPTHPRLQLVHIPVSEPVPDKGTRNDGMGLNQRFSNCCPRWAALAPLGSMLETQILQLHSGCTEPETLGVWGPVMEPESGSVQPASGACVLTGHTVC